MQEYNIHSVIEGDIFKAGLAEGMDMNKSARQSPECILVVPFRGFGLSWLYYPLNYCSSKMLFKTAVSSLKLLGLVIYLSVSWIMDSCSAAFSE